MTLDQFREHAMRTVAEVRGLPFDSSNTSLLHGYTVDEVCRVVRRSKSYVYHSNIRPSSTNWRKEYEFGEIAELMRRSGRLVC